MNPIHFMPDALVKIAITRAAKEYMKAQGSGDLGMMKDIHQNYTNAGLPMRSGAVVNEGGLEQAVRTGFGNITERPGQTVSRVSGLQNPEHGWAEKLMKRDSPITTGADAVNLAKQRMEVTRQAQSLGGDAQKMLAPTHASRVIHGADGSMGLATYQDYYPNAKTVGAVGRGGNVTGARQMVSDVNSKLVAPLQQQYGTKLRDIASMNNGSVVGNKGSIIQTSQGPKLIDHIPQLQNQKSPVQTIETATGSQVISPSGRTDTSWYPKNNQQMNQLARSNYAPTAQNTVAPVNRRTLETGHTALSAGGNSYAATQAAPTANSIVRQPVARDASGTVAAIPKAKMPTMPSAPAATALAKPANTAITAVTKALPKTPASSIKTIVSKMR